MTLLVTGGCGFIGSNFIRYILKEHSDWIVINLDKLTYAGNLASLADVESQYGVSRNPSTTSTYAPRYVFIKGDICNVKLIDSIFTGDYFIKHQTPIADPIQKIDMVVNFAAESHVDRSILDASPFINTNIKGTHVLLEAGRMHWKTDSQSVSTTDQRQQTKNNARIFLQISTDEVYGSLGEKGKFTEESPLRPNSPYAASKAGADLLCRSYVKAYGVPVIISRSSNNYGPYQFPEKLIPLMIRNTLIGGELPVYGKGKEIREWLFVEDNCRAIDFLLGKGRVGEIYNIGSGCERENINVVNLICDILERQTHGNSLRTKIRHILDPRGSAHDFRYSLDCSKIKEELGWEPKIQFEQGLEHTVKWYFEHQDWTNGVITGEYQHYYQKIYGHR